MNGILEDRGAALGGQASTIRPGFLSDTAITMEISTDLADIHAEAYLRQVFGVSALTPGSQTTSQTVSKMEAALLDGISSGVGKMMDCLRSEMDRATDFGQERAARNCMTVVRDAIRDDIVEDIAAVQQRAASAMNALTSLLPKRLVGRGLTDYAERMVFNAEMTEVAKNTAQFGLTFPGVTATTDEFLDYSGDRLTSLGIRKSYDFATRNLHETDQGILEQLGAPEVAERFVRYAGARGCIRLCATSRNWFRCGGSGVRFLRSIRSSLFRSGILDQRAESNPGKHSVGSSGSLSAQPRHTRL